MTDFERDITLQLTKMVGDIEHIKDKVNENNKHLEKINGRLRTAENNITGIKSIGITLYAIIGVLLAWLGIKQ
ncbi:MAG: hypothetical protein Tp1122DCM00d2C27307611_38 [Prokaryotic dsDNA virus sp.]|mgnify:CR=1 FL=1|nr:MAG: hypothetical protein Tp1122DCM00d2C27307611_38 [Prokaryotic dsDNA virus sp.]|tara:strand:- start:24617 stop:24835 length:219 start_codon:yes stop_codon:yes gene_type:complete